MKHLITPTKSRNLIKIIISVLYNIPKFYEHVVTDAIETIQTTDGQFINVTVSEDT